MYDDCNHDLIHKTIIDLMNSYNNLYVDISHDATIFYLKNINKLLEFDSTKVIIGTDINLAIKRVIDNPSKEINKIYDNFNKLSKMGNFNISIKKLFK
jgi:hypothetical protein